MALRGGFQDSANGIPSSSSEEEGALAVQQVDRRAKELAQLDHDDAVARLMGDERDTGRRPLYANADSSPKARKQKEEDDRQRRERLVQLLNEQLKALYEERARLYERLAEIEQERQDNDEKAEALQQRFEDLEAARRSALEQGSFERNPDGRFRNQALEEAVAAVERRTGKKVDRDNFEEINAILLQAQAEARAECEAREQRDRLLRLEGQQVSNAIDDIDQRIDRTEELLRNQDAPDFEPKAQSAVSLPAKTDTAPGPQLAEPPVAANRSNFQFQFPS